MITQLLDEAAKFSEKREWCDEETKKTLSQEKIHDTQIKKVAARLDEVVAEIPIQQSSMKRNTKLIGEVTQSMKQALKIRQTESAHAKKVYSSIYRESIRLFVYSSIRNIICSRVFVF